MTTGIRIDVENPDNHKKVLEVLDSKNYQYFMYHTIATRLVFKQWMKKKRSSGNGWHKEIAQLLKEFGVAPKKIATLQLRKPRYNNQAVYMLYFKAGVTSMQQFVKSNTLTTQKSIGIDTGPQIWQYCTLS